MLKFRWKLGLCMPLCLAMLSWYSYVMAQAVSVTVNPGSKTVKAAGTGAITEKNKATYTITGTFDEKSLETVEHKPGTATWTCTTDSVTFVPPRGVAPVPPAPNPGPSVSAPVGTPSTWTSTATSASAGEWTIKYKVTVSYVKIKKTDNKTDGTFGPYEGKGSCTLIATGARFRLEIKPEDDFIGNRNTLGIGEPAEVVLSKWDPTDPAVVFVSMYTTGTNTATPPTITLTGVSTNSAAPSASRAFTAGDYAGEGTLTVNATVGGVPATESIGVSVLEPSGAGIIQEPNTFKRHHNDTASVGFKGLSYYTPTSVSFWKVQFREGWCEGKGEGYFKNKKQNHEVDENAWWDVKKGISPKTNRPNTEISSDEIYSGKYTTKPYSNGNFSWPIPWYYKCGSHQGTITTMMQTWTIDAQGNMSISKGGTTKSADYGDRDSSYAAGPDK